MSLFSGKFLKISSIFSFLSLAAGGAFFGYTKYDEYKVEQYKIEKNKQLVEYNRLDNQVLRLFTSIDNALDGISEEDKVKLSKTISSDATKATITMETIKLMGSLSNNNFLTSIKDSNKYTYFLGSIGQVLSKKDPSILKFNSQEIEKINKENSKDAQMRRANAILSWKIISKGPSAFMKSLIS